MPVDLLGKRQEIRSTYTRELRVEPEPSHRVTSARG